MLWYSPNVSRRRNQSFTHALWFLRPLNGNWHKKTAWQIQIVRSSNQRSSVKKGVIRNIAKFTGKHLCQSLFFNKVAGLRPTTLFKEKDSGTGVFLWILKFLKTPFLLNTSRIASSNNSFHQSSLRLGDVVRELYYWKILFHYF